MELKLALPVLKIRRGPTFRGRKLANKGDVRVMATEMCGCHLPRIICPSISPPHASPVPLAVPLPWGSRNCSNRAPASQSPRENGRAGMAAEVKDEEWGDRQKMVGALRVVICILLILWPGREQALALKLKQSPPSIHLFLVNQAVSSSM